MQRERGVYLAAGFFAPAAGFLPAAGLAASLGPAAAFLPPAEAAGLAPALAASAAAAAASLPLLDFTTFFTFACSSSRNERRMRPFTQRWHREPPYARETVFFFFYRLCSFCGRNAGMPRSFRPQSPHLGTETCFLRYCTDRRWPGVFTTLRLLLAVLYGLR